MLCLSCFELYSRWVPLFSRACKGMAKCVRYIEVLFNTSYYDWGKENRSLYRGLRCIEVRYIEFSL